MPRGLSGCTMEEVISLFTGIQSMRSPEGKVDGKVFSEAKELKI